MGHTLTPSEEAQQLRQATREAHEAMQGLSDLLRQVKQLHPTLVADFEAVHDREIKLLSNFLNEESNRLAADLNRHVDAAKQMISDQIMAGEAVFDRDTATVRIRFGSTKFDDQTPLPYPEVTPKETKQ